MSGTGQGVARSKQDLRAAGSALQWEMCVPSSVCSCWELRKGDRRLIPKRNQEATILGDVQSPTSHVYRAGLKREDYIAKSGGATQKADRKRIYVVRANGDVFS